jgi:hypothetical protein
MSAEQHEGSRAGVDPETDTGSVWRRRTWILLALGVALVLQFGWAARHQPQPYPAIILPGFGTTSQGLESKFDRTIITVRYDDGYETSPYPSEFFGDFNYASIPGTITHVFDPAESGSNRRISADVRNWLTARAEALHSGATPVEVQFCWQSGTVNLKELTLRHGPCERTRKIAL